MKLKFEQSIGVHHRYYIRRILNPDGNLIIGELNHADPKDKYLTYHHWHNFYVYSQLPLDEREQINDFTLSHLPNQITLEFID